jgi:hypothetical protein
MRIALAQAVQIDARLDLDLAGGDAAQVAAVEVAAHGRRGQRPGRSGLRARHSFGSALCGWVGRSF